MIPHFLMGLLMYSNSNILPDDSSGNLHITIYCILFGLTFFGFMCITLGRLLCYEPLIKRFKFCGRKTKSMPSYDINNELSALQLYKEFIKTKDETVVSVARIAHSGNKEVDEAETGEEGGEDGAMQDAVVA